MRILVVTSRCVEQFKKDYRHGMAQGIDHIIARTNACLMQTGVVVVVRVDACAP